MSWTFWKVTRRPMHLLKKPFSFKKNSDRWKRKVLYSFVDAENFIITVVKASLATITMPYLLRMNCKFIFSSCSLWFVYSYFSPCVFKLTCFLTWNVPQSFTSFAKRQTKYFLFWCDNAYSLASVHHHCPSPLDGALCINLRVVVVYCGRWSLDGYDRLAEMAKDTIPWCNVWWDTLHCSYRNHPHLLLL